MIMTEDNSTAERIMALLKTKYRQYRDNESRLLDNFYDAYRAVRISSNDSTNNSTINPWSYMPNPWSYMNPTGTGTIMVNGPSVEIPETDLSDEDLKLLYRLRQQGNDYDAIIRSFNMARARYEYSYVLYDKHLRNKTASISISAYTRCNMSHLPILRYDIEINSIIKVIKPQHIGYLKEGSVYTGENCFDYLSNSMFTDAKNVTFEAYICADDEDAKERFIKCLEAAYITLYAINEAHIMTERYYQASIYSAMHKALLGDNFKMRENSYKMY